MDDLNVIDPAGTAVNFRGERLEIKPLTIGQLPQFTRLINPVMELLLNSGRTGQSETRELEFLVDLLADHADNIFEAAALATGRERAWLEGAPGDDLSKFIELVHVIIKVNKDFFSRKLAVLLEARARSSAGIGPTASSTSSAQAIH
jgi:hypothetical protein